MMRALFSGVSGLRSHQTRMDNIANNVANVNTIGFKSTRVTFADIFSQTLAGAISADEAAGRGGKNPMQIGLGATVASIDRLFTQGAASRTDFPYDLMINGDSFFIVGDVSGQYFTRAGAFNFDANGNFVNSDGMAVYGWQRVRDENGDYVIQRGPVSPIRITDEMRISQPEATTRMKFSGNLNPLSEEYITKMNFYDSLGFLYETDVKFTFQPEATGDGLNVWTFQINPEMYRVDNPDEKITLSGQLNGTIIFDTDGELVRPNSINLFILESGRAPVSDFGNQNGDTTPDPNSESAAFADAQGAINIDLNGLTQYGDVASMAKSEKLNGHHAGYLQDVSVGSDGVVTARYTNGQYNILAQVAVTRFENPQGLESYGSNLFITTANSGRFDGIGEAVEDAGGKILPGNLEMSNVDLAGEFTNMIVTQRGFQANSRIISVSDDLLHELVNLKR